MDLGFDLLNIIEPLQPDIKNYNSKIDSFLICRFKDKFLNIQPARRYIRKSVAHFLPDGTRRRRNPVSRTDNFLQIMICNIVAGLPVEYVRQPRQGPPFVGQPLEELQRIGYVPAGICLNENKFLILGRYLIGITIPLHEPFFKIINLLDKRDLQFQTRSGFGLTNRFPELRYNNLFGLPDLENRIQDNNQGCKQCR